MNLDIRPDNSESLDLAKNDLFLRSRSERDKLSTNLTDDSSSGREYDCWVGPGNTPESEYLKPYENGEYPPNKEVLKPGNDGVIIHKDVGLLFYEVQSGDAKGIGHIRQKLMALRNPNYDFSYLGDLPTTGLLSFNIDSRYLRVGMLIPIPTPPENRRVTEEQFSEHCRTAIQELKTHPVYGPKLQAILKNGTTENQLVALMIAAAKQECGDKPLGQFVFHRYEVAHQVFSYSIYHVLDEGAGIRARRNLDMTIGQTYHFTNASKLFLAFILEKTPNNYLNYFPPTRDWEAYASMYNGASWRQYNPDYVSTMSSFYRESLASLEGRGPIPAAPPAQARVEDDDTGVVLRERESAPSDPSLERIGSRNMTKVIQDLNYQFPSAERPFTLNEQILKMKDAVHAFLRAKYQGNDTYFRDDRVDLRKDAQGVYMVFERNGEQGVIRYPSSTEQPQQAPTPSAPRPSQTPPTAPRQSTEALPSLSAKWKQIGSRSLQAPIQDLNWEFSPRPFTTDQQIFNASLDLEQQIRDTFGGPNFWPDDKIGLGKDSQGWFLVLERQAERLNAGQPQRTPKLYF